MTVLFLFLVPRIQAGDSVLIVGHKNSFRALWKYIERIPDSDALDSKMARRYGFCFKKAERNS